MKTKSGKIMLTVSVGAFVLSGAWINLSFDSINQGGKKEKWIAPAEAKNLKNPAAASKESTDAGKLLYDKHCKSCHGVKGKGDGPKSAELETPCGDFSEKEFQAQTDGELFWKTKEGREDMPSFKKKIPDDGEIWSIVNYVRTFKAGAAK